MLDAVLNVFAVLEQAVPHPFREAGNRLLVAMQESKTRKPDICARLTSICRSILGPTGHGSHDATEAVPQITIAPVARDRSTASLIRPAVLSK